MILGIGVDSVEISRFNNFHEYSRKKLKRIYTEEEIDYSLLIAKKSAERFALRFAVKEAFFKAVSTGLGYQGNLMQLLTLVSLKYDQNKKPTIKVEWKKVVSLYLYKQKLPQVLFSCTHTKNIATSYILIEK